MGEYIIKLPDVGEGVAEAELVEWNVKIGDLVREDTVLAAVMTDKATVEIPSPVDGEIVWLGGEIGQVLAIGSPLVRLKIEGEGHVVEAPAKSVKTEAPAPEVEKKAEAPKAPAEKPRSIVPPTAQKTPGSPSPFSANAPRNEGEKPLASPAVRLRAKEAGVDLRQVSGSGPAGRISHEDLEAFFARDKQKPGITALAPDNSVKEIKVVGLRRKIAEKMAIAKSHIPHITYVEEIDVTSLEELRAMPMCTPPC